MEIKVRMMTAQTFAVNEEKRAGGARLAAKQVCDKCRVSNTCEPADCVWNAFKDTNQVPPQALQMVAEVSGIGCEWFLTVCGMTNQINLTKASTYLDITRSQGFRIWECNHGISEICKL